MRTKQQDVTGRRVDALFADAEAHVAAGRNSDALKSLKAAIGLSREPDVARRAGALLARLNPKVTSTSPHAGASGALQGAVEGYLRDPGNPGVAQVIHNAIGRLVARLSRQPVSSLTSAETHELAVLLPGRAFEDPDGGWRAGVLAAVGESVPFLIQALLTAPWHLEALPPLHQIPASLRCPLLQNLLQAPRCFDEPGLAERYHSHVTRVAALVRGEIGQSSTPDAAAVNLADCFLQNLNCLPLYVSRDDTLPLMRERAAFAELVLKSVGRGVDYVARPSPTSRNRLRIGFLSQHFGHQTETYVTLGSLHLDRSRFQVALFAVAANAGPTEDYARGLADEFHILPKTLGEQVEAIRRAALDIVVIGTNITAVTNRVGLIALHRLAPVQLASYCSPMSSGFRNIDYFLHSRHSTHPAGDLQFSEKLIHVDGPPGCPDYTVEPRPETGPRTRAEFGIADDELVFVNAASVYKISYEALDAWCRILSRVEKSRLMLMPYNPNWASSFPIAKFGELLGKLAERHGISRDRVVLVESQRNRQAVMNVERVGDVYLDTFPFSGTLAVHDILEIGMPVVASAGVSFREQLSAAILRELGLGDIVAATTDEYLAYAELLGRDAALRARTGARIRQAFAGRSAATTPALFGAHLSDVLWKLVRPDSHP